MPIDFLDEMTWRGLAHQCTDEPGLRDHLSSGRRRCYAGFDPTADSLTIGNLVPIMALVHFARSGHEPIVVMGGGTGLIGDPSGKSAERQLLTRDRVMQHVESQSRIFSNVWRNAGLDADPEIMDNAEWLTKLGYIEALRDIGKHFSVNMMVQKESVRARLEDRDHGISYTEFSYMILQAYDFAHLYEHAGVTVQLGGSDQWGNIVAGADLIRRIHAEEERPSAGESSEQHDSLSFGLTVPLVTKGDGGKFGKTESGAIWLTPERTSPYAMYQFWLNTGDADVIRFLKIFTLLAEGEVAAIERAHMEHPEHREAHRALAMGATMLVHGRDEAEGAEAAAKALFSGDVAALPEPTLREVFAEIPSSEHPKASLGDGVDLVPLLVETGLAKSNREAREFLQNGSVSVNGRRVGPDDTLSTADLLHGSMMALRRGKKTWRLTRWV